MKNTMIKVAMVAAIAGSFAAGTVANAGGNWVGAPNSGKSKNSSTVLVIGVGTSFGVSGGLTYQDSTSTASANGSGSAFSGGGTNGGGGGKGGTFSGGGNDNGGGDSVSFSSGGAHGSTVSFASAGK